MLQFLLDESLNIWAVADECSKEYPNTTRYAWLVNMARAIYSEPPTLLLRPDKSWDKVKPRRTFNRGILSSGVNIDGITWGVGPMFESPTQRKHRRMAEQRTRQLERERPDPEIVPYDKDESRLKNLVIRPPTSTNEPPWIKPNTFKEKVHRDDFCAWCETSGHPLPRFWFTDEERQHQPMEQPPLLSPSEQLRSEQKNYCTPQEKRAASHAVLASIKEKINSKENWHHLSELRIYMRQKAINEAKEGGLNNAVKAALKKEGISPANGKAPKI